MITQKRVKKELLDFGQFTSIDAVLILEALMLGLPLVGLLYLVKGKNWTIPFDLRGALNVPADGTRNTPGPIPITIPPVTIPPKIIGGFDASWHLHQSSATVQTLSVDSSGRLNCEADMPDLDPTIQNGRYKWGPYGDVSAQIGWQDYGFQQGPVMKPNTVDVQFTDQGTTVKTKYPGAHYSGDGFIAFYYHLLTPQTAGIPLPPGVQGPPQPVTCPNLDIQYLLWQNTDSPGGAPFYTTFQDGTPKSFHIDRPWPGGPVNIPKIATDFARSLNALNPNGINGAYDSMGIEIGIEGYRTHIKGQFGVTIT